METIKINKKIFVLIPPAVGHVNPACGLLSELSARCNVTAFCDAEFESCIRKTGASFIPYSSPTRPLFAKILKCIEKKRREAMLQCCVEFTDRALPQLVSECVSRAPDIIVFDCFFTPAKYLCKILTKMMLSEKPRMIMFVPNFPVTSVANKSTLLDKPRKLFNQVLGFIYISYSYLIYYSTDNGFYIEV